MGIHLQQYPSNKDVVEAEHYFQRGLELLKKQKPHQAIPMLQTALKLDPTHKDAQTIFQDANESLKWNVAHFCQNCGAFIKPEGTFPFNLEIREHCSTCGSPVPTARKERIISFTENVVKFLLIGPFPILVLYFIGIPNFVLDTVGQIGFRYRPIPEGLVRSISLTPIITLLLITIDPKRGGADLLYEAVFNIGSILTPLKNIHFIIYFASALLLVFAFLYIYFLVMLTPIFAAHRKGQWKQWKHQRLVILFAFAFVLLVTVSHVYAIFTDTRYPF